MWKKVVVVAYFLLGLGFVIIGMLTLFLPGERPLPPFYGISELLFGAAFIIFAAVLHMRKKWP